MTVALTVVGKNSVGNMRSVSGTFTSAANDKTVSITPTEHGCGYVDWAEVTLDAGAAGTEQPKIAISNGTVTATFNDTQGLSGRWVVTGK